MKQINVTLYRYNELKTEDARKRAAKSYFGTDYNMVYQEVSRLLAGIAKDELKDRGVSVAGGLTAHHNLSGDYDNVSYDFVALDGQMSWRGWEFQVKVDDYYNEQDKNCIESFPPEPDGCTEDLMTKAQAKARDELAEKLKTVTKYLTSIVVGLQAKAEANLELQMTGTDAYFMENGRCVSKDILDLLAGE